MQTENNTSKPKDSPEQEAGDECSGATCSAGYVHWTETTPSREGYYWRKNPMGTTKIVLITEELDVMTIYGDFRPVAEYSQGGMWAGPIPLPNKQAMPVDSVKNEPDRVVRCLGDFDVWYLPCERCGYDTAKSSKEDVKYCWKCGNRIYRDFTDRALKSPP